MEPLPSTCVSDETMWAVSTGHDGMTDRRVYPVSDPWPTKRQASVYPIRPALSFRAYLAMKVPRSMTRQMDAQ
ncbi:hypothetical protein BLM14_25115 (plasmid) [Phyllobacterium zundukense]|nr:hypothetical protein BLM14_25115 [Phyllobacterium zundukense]